MHVTTARLGTRLKRGVVTVVMGILAILAVGAVYQLIDSAIVRHRVPPPGQMVRFDGSSLHMQSTGQGGPTVVFEAGLGGLSIDWARVASVVAATNRVVTYDRAGAGWSDPSPQPRTGEQIAAELHALLIKAGIPGPYILVGHSLGGIYMQDFAAAYPDDVIGLVLVDSTVLAPLTPEIRAGLSAADQRVLERSVGEQRAAVTASSRLWALSAYVGLPRLLTVTHLLDGSPPNLPNELQPTSAALRGQPKQLTTAWREATAAQRASDTIPNLGDLPVIILRPAMPGDTTLPAGLSDAGRDFLQNATLTEPLLALSSRSHVVVVADSGHYIQLDQPTAVVDAINELTATWQTLTQH